MGESYTFTITEGCNGIDGRISVNYDDFISDVEVNDILLVSWYWMLIEGLQETPKF